MAERNRKEAEEYLYKFLGKLDHTGKNVKYYRDKLSKLSDSEFEKFIKEMEDGKRKIPLYIPNLKINLRMRNIKKVAKELGVELFQRIKYYNDNLDRWIITKHEYLILMLPVRRVKQFLMDKISIPDSDKKLDYLTGQVVKPDKGSSVSMVELATFDSKGLSKSALELVAVRGGNTTAYAAFKGELMSNGSSKAMPYLDKSITRSVVSAANILRGMHLDTNLDIKKPGEKDE